MKRFKRVGGSVFGLLIWTVAVFAQTTVSVQNLTHEAMIEKIMGLSGLKVQIPQIANTIVHREDLKEYLDSLSPENREALEREIALAFDGKAMLEIVEDEMSQTLSDDEARKLLKWFTSDDAKAMTAMEEIPKERENWKEIYRTKKDPKPDAGRLRLYEMLLSAINYSSHIDQKVMLRRLLMGLIRQELQGYEIETILKKERKQMIKEDRNTALLSLTYDLESVDDAVLEKYLHFLAGSAAQSYQKGKNIGIIRAISAAGDRVLSKAEELVVKYPYPSPGDLRPKSQKLIDYLGACQNGEMQACCDLGYAYRKGHGVKTDYFKALAPLKMSCDGGIAKGCGVLGDMYSLGLGVKVNLTRAARYYTRACDLGSSLNCTSIGVNYSTGYGVPKDQKKANAYFLKACNGGEEIACRNLGNQYRWGAGTPIDPVKARTFYEKACNRDDSPGCYMAGLYYFDGIGVARNLQRAKTLFALSCQLSKNSDGCIRAGDACIMENNTTQSIKEALSFYIKACNKPRGKDRKGCYRAGMIYAGTFGFKRDTTRAKRFFKNGCDRGDRASCSEYRKLNNTPSSGD